MRPIYKTQLYFFLYTTSEQSEYKIFKKYFKCLVNIASKMQNSFEISLRKYMYYI